MFVPRSRIQRKNGISTKVLSRDYLPAWLAQSRQCELADKEHSCLGIKLTASRFRLAALQLKRLQSKRLLLESDVEDVLKSLPNEINSMYDNIIQEGIHDGHRTLALRVLRWNALPFRPLAIEEISEVCAIPSEFELGTPVALKKDRHLTLDQLLRLLPELVILFNVFWYTETGFEHSSLTFAHFSVLEYLTGSQSMEHSSASSIIQPREDHCQIAKECLAYLHLSQETKSNGSLREYASEHWQLHSVAIGELDEITRRNAFALSASVLSGSLEALDEELPKDFFYVTRWLGDPKHIQKLILILRKCALRDTGIKWIRTALTHG